MPLSPRHRLSGIVARFSGCRIGERRSTQGFGPVLRPPDNTGEYQVRFPHRLQDRLAGWSEVQPAAAMPEADRDGLPDVWRPAAAPSWLLLAAKNANQEVYTIEIIGNFL
jgi:hypothetical protein